MKKLIRHARVLVTDGAKALVLRNEGDAFAPELKVVRSYSQDNPPSRDQGSDKPGRTNDSMGRKSAMEIPDLHREAEDRFVATIVEDMTRDLRAGDFDTLVVVAPPVALGVYRKAAPAALAKVTILEIGKDLVKHTPADIATHVVTALEAA